MLWCGVWSLNVRCQERGITILAKNAAVTYKGVKVSMAHHGTLEESQEKSENQYVILHNLCSQWSLAVWLGHCWMYLHAKVVVEECFDNSVQIHLNPLVQTRNSGEKWWFFKRRCLRKGFKKATKKPIRFHPPRHKKPSILFGRSTSWTPRGTQTSALKSNGFWTWPGMPSWGLGGCFAECLFWFYRFNNYVFSWYLLCDPNPGVQVPMWHCQEKPDDGIAV